MLRGTLRQRKKKNQSLESLEQSFEEINELLNSLPLMMKKIDWNTVNQEFQRLKN